MGYEQVGGLLFWIISIVGFVGVLKARLQRLKPGAGSYKKRDRFLSAGELRFFYTLRQVNDGHFEIIAKPRLADLIETTQHDRSSFARISQKHVDFVLCDKETMEPVLVVELDDSSHQRPDRISRDLFVDAALKAARLRILHVRVTRDYSGLAADIARAVEADLV